MSNSQFAITRKLVQTTIDELLAKKVHCKRLFFYIRFFLFSFHKYLLFASHKARNRVVDKHLQKHNEKFKPNGSLEIPRRFAQLVRHDRRYSHGQRFVENVFNSHQAEFDCINSSLFYF